MEARASPSPSPQRPASMGRGGGGGGGGGDASAALSFIYKGWREVRDSASADLRLMRARADSLRTLADRELEHLLVSASTTVAAPAPPVAAGAPIAEVEFVRNRIQPKISELRRQYAASGDWELGLGRRVLEGWVAPPPPRGATTARVDLSGITAIRNALVPEVAGGGGASTAWWSGDEMEEEEEKEWEVVRMIRGGLKELERRSQSSGEILGGIPGPSELVEKFKSRLVISALNLIVSLMQVLCMKKKTRIRDLVLA
jgi:digalactosyldiacylglycerol synthase